MTLAATASAALSSLPSGQGWRQAGELGMALLLSAGIGVEREIRQKNAGLRTYTLVGLGAALFVLISKYGFSDVLRAGTVVLDPSRVAAQIVSGVGFLGAGLIFVRRDAVRGLTTAAAIWITAAIGAAAGAGLDILAAEATVAYLVTALAFPALARRLPRSPAAEAFLRVRYPDGRGVLRRLLKTVTDQGFTVGALDARSIDSRAAEGDEKPGRRGMVEVVLTVRGRYPVSELAAMLSEIEEVDAVLVGDNGEAA